MNRSFFENGIFFMKFLLSWFFLALLLAGAPAVDAKESVLFLAAREWNTTFSLHTYDEGVEAGYEVKVGTYADIRSFADLKKFNVVVINSMPLINSDGKVQPEQAVFETPCKEYLEKGGSVIFNCAGGEWSKGVPAMNSFLAPYGARIHEEQLVDVANFIGKTDKIGAFHSTRQIKPHELTKNIKMLGYPGVATRADAMKTASPLTFSDENAWTVLATGEKTAMSVKAAEPGNSPRLEKTGATYRSLPVYLAVRNVGKGILLADGVNSAFSSASPEIFNHMLWRKDDMTTPDLPQNRSFLLQAVKILAGRSAAQGFGGFVADPGFVPDSKHVLKGKSTDWSKVPPLLKSLPDFDAMPGLVGAQSTFSGGRFAVAEMAQAARKSGLKFLVFTEKLEMMNPEKWKELKKACAAASDDHFLAIPGLLSRDRIGNTWFAFGAVANFPQPPSITRDGKWMDNVYQFNAKNFGLRMTGYAYAGKNPNPWSEMRQCSGFPVFTWLNGKEEDDALGDFFKSCWNMESMIPFSVTFVDSPAAIAATAANAPLNIFTGEYAEELADYSIGQGFGSGHTESPKKWYLATQDGPRLGQFGAVSGGFGVNIPAENRSALAFRLEKLRPGDIVRLHDGEKVLRQWVIGSETQLKTEFRWPVEQIRIPLLTVEREKRPVLVSSGLPLQFGSFYNQCGDRQNTIPYVYLPDAHGNVNVSGTPIEMKYREWAPNVLVYAPVKVWAATAIGLEIGAQIFSSWSGGVQIPIKGELQERRQSLSSFHYPVMSSVDMMIVDDIAGRIHPNGKTHLGDCYPPQQTEPLRTFNYTARKYAIYGRIKEGQVNGQLLEGTIRILRDIELENPYIEVAVANMASATHGEYRVNGNVKNITFGNAPDRNLNLKLAAGDYFGVYPFGLTNGGGVFAVSDNVFASAKNDASSLTFKIRVPTKLAKGGVIRYALLFTNGGSVPVRLESDYLRIRKHFGFDGSFPALESVEDAELNPASRVMPEIKADPARALTVRTRATPEAPTGLPLRITGLHPRRTVAYRLNDEPFLRFAGNDGQDYYTHLYVDQKPNRLVLGHPVTADDPEIVITLNDFSGKYQDFEVYNPTNDERSVTLRANPALTGREWSRTLKLAPLQKEIVSVK